MSSYGQPLVIVSNRLPVVVTRDDNDNWQVEPAAGGLVTALSPLMRREHGLWIGWPGCSPDAEVDSLLEQYGRETGYSLGPVPLDDDEVDRYYRGFANQTIWPLFHDLLGHCRFEAAHWSSYVEVNRKFAEVVAGLIHPDSIVWIHDYQLLLVGHFLRDLGLSHRLHFFLHIPFPSYDLFRRLPWKQEVIEALLAYDHLGFQTFLDRRNFAHCVRSLMPETTARVVARKTGIEYADRYVKLGHYPVSIDFDEFDSQARSHEVRESAYYVHKNLPGRSLILGIDRLDYTKGIPQRLLAFERTLEKYPDLQGHVSLVQIVIPSRVKVPEYQHLKQELDELIGRINARYSEHGWVPIHYMYRQLDRVQLLGHYRACEIALITPLRDGMNLVAKEYCASSIDDNGVLILSEFAGAAAQLSKAAIMVNPYDLEGTADAIYAAYIMNLQERQRRMRILRQEVKRNDVNKWLDSFIGSTPAPNNSAPVSPAVEATRDD